MTVCKTKVLSDNMESKWIFFIFAYFSLCMNHKYTHIHAEENISDIYFDQISRLRNCQRRTSEKVTCQRCFHILMIHQIFILRFGV